MIGTVKRPNAPLLLGGSRGYPMLSHHPTGYKSTLSESHHWSKFESHPSKCTLSRRPMTFVTVPTHIKRGSIRSTASSFMSNLNLQFVTSCQRNWINSPALATHNRQFKQQWIDNMHQHLTIIVLTVSVKIFLKKSSKNIRQSRRDIQSFSKV